jgi:hypothetical protein
VESQVRDEVSHEPELSLFVFTLGCKQHTLENLFSHGPTASMWFEEPVRSRLLAAIKLFLDAPHGKCDHSADPLLFPWTQHSLVDFRS